MNSVPFLILGGLYVLVQVIFSGVFGGYGIFRDEFYYVVNAERLAWRNHPAAIPDV
jgi:hypothetical protein